MSVGVLILVIIIVILLTKKKNETVVVYNTSEGSDSAVAVDTPTKKEGFSPEVNINIGRTEASDNWLETIQSMSLDPSVVKSHNRFVEERNKVSSGASQLPERDDRLDVNNWVGLRPPDYTRVKVSSDARTVPSIDYDKDDLIAPTKELCWRN